MTDREKEDSTPARKEATGRPWVYDPALPSNVYSDDATGSIIAACDRSRLAPRSDAEKHANAALIVEAVNALEPNERRIEELESELAEIKEDKAWQEYQHAKSMAGAHDLANFGWNFWKEKSDSAESRNAELTEALRNLLELAEHGDFKNGVTYNCIDEGEVFASGVIESARAALEGTKA